MQCRDVECNLVAWVEGTLSAEVNQMVAEHVHSCAVCARLAGRMQQIWQLHKAPETAHLSPWFLSNLERRIREKERISKPVI